MKKVMLMLITVILILSGCTTTGFLGLAKTTYVDERFAETDEKIITELEQLRKDIEQITELTDELDNLLNEISATKQATEDLQELAKGIEARFKELPKETLYQLVQIIQHYLEETQ